MTLREAIHLLVERIDLSEDEMSSCMAEIMEGGSTDAQIGSFLTALRMKGETSAEIAGAVRIMRAKALRIAAPQGVIDTCGTGGDMSGTFNISTTTAIVVAAAGVPVAKHGNRSVSSRAGSADVLEALGIKIDLSPEKVEKCLFETGFGFLFAPLFHPAMKFAVGPRRELGVRTIFNALGPLTNPAGARRQIVGVFSAGLTEVLAEVLGSVGADDVMVIHGEDGLDEISICDGTRVSRFRKSAIETFYLTPEDFGFTRADVSSLVGGDGEKNAGITTGVLKGEKGPRREIVLMNASAALVVAGLTESFTTARDIAAEVIDSGKALKKLEEIRHVTSTL